MKYTFHHEIVFLILIFAAVARATTPSSTSVAGTSDRYSRQVYTLGARAHGEIRKSVIYLDGPIFEANDEGSASISGLLMECAKDLALSGVGEIVLLLEDNESEQSRKFQIVHESFCDKLELDDLGKAYLRAARAECSSKSESGNSIYELVAEFIRKLNPQVKVSLMSRCKFISSGIDSRNMNQQMVLICIDRPESTQSMLCSLCRDAIRFISVETHGFFGRIFCDFGDNFEVLDEDGENPLRTLVKSVDEVDRENDLLEVNCLDGERHDVSKGDIIEFFSNEGKMLSLKLKVEKIMTPFRFTCSKEPGCMRYNEIDPSLFRSSTFSRIKEPRKIPFLSFENALKLAKSRAMNSASQSLSIDHQLYTPSDMDKSFNEKRRNLIMGSFAALSSFVGETYRTPSDKKEDLDFFYNLMLEHQLNKSDYELEKVFNNFYRCVSSGGKFVPVQAFFGALAAQEALKAVSSLYNPISQFLIYDCDELSTIARNENCEDEEDRELTKNRCPSGLKSLLGNSSSLGISSQKLFVVGAGAIGCELLKNLAAMGAGVARDGHLILTDMDTIEYSNLSRQLLFRDSDVGKFKSFAAKEAIAKYNPRTKLEAHSSKVGGDVGPFDDSFWTKRVDIVLNALDNVDARLFVDGRCVESQKGLIDAGTLGAKGNVQVVVPMLSESYGSSVDPPEPAIPVCTLKNFPYDISHTIQWGRDIFDGLYNRRPLQANKFAHFSSTEEIALDLIKTLGEDAALEAAREISEDLSLSWFYEVDSVNMEAILMKDSITWAVRLYHKLFVEATEDLLKKHPQDSLDEDGEPFWSGTRRIPRIVRYLDDSHSESNAKANAYIEDFVRCAARLRTETYLKSHHLEKVDKKPSRESVSKCLRESISEVNDVNDSTSSLVSNIVSLFENVKLGESINSIDFEKDDDCNDHVAFVTAASNLRALTYGIVPADEMETRRIAGRIVPAMITTTAIVSALSCIELVKLIHKLPLSDHRNSFINLALPFFAMTAPLPAEEMLGPNGTVHTIWDRIEVKEKRKQVAGGGITLKQLLRKVAKVTESVVNSLSYGPYLIYADFLHEDDEELLSTSIWEVVKSALVSNDDDFEEFRNKDQGSSNQSADMEAIDSKSYLEFTAVAEDETGLEIELPPLRIIRGCL